MLDLLMINPNNRIVSTYAGVEPPLWAGLIAGYYRKQGERVSILDAEAEDLTIEQTVEAIHKVKPQEVIIVVMGNNPSASSTPKMVVADEIYNLIYEGIPTVFTGLHPQAVKRKTTAYYDFTYDMPSIPWQLLPMDKYKAHNWHCLDGSTRSPYASIYTSLGCPFSCEFCNIHVLYGGEHKVWYRKPEEVIAEIDLLVNKYKVRNIKFWDELFTLNPDHVRNICDGIINRGYDLNIWAYARVNTVNHELLPLMKQAGINWLAYGFESGSDKILAQVNKRASKAEAIKAVSMTHDAGINIIGNFIFGLSGDTEETMRETLEFAKRLKLEYVNFYAAKAYPGSPIYEKNKDKDNEDWSSYSQFTEANSEVNEFRDKAFNEFFTDKNYLNRIENKFGKQAVRHISEMLKLGKPIARGN